jgi:hypothetical protein
MRNATFILLVTFILTGCQREFELKTNPFRPNHGITKSDIVRLGFEATSFEEGVCSYEKEFTNSKMIFLLDEANDCNEVVHQVTLLRITNDSTTFQEDSLEIQTLLDGLNGVKISNSKQKGNSNILTFVVKDRISNDLFECDYIKYPNGKKYLSFEYAIKDEQQSIGRTPNYLSYAITLIIGLIIGVFAPYLSGILMDRRKRNELEKSVSSQYSEVERKIPNLINEMREDFSDPNNSAIRTFFIIPKRSIVFNHPGIYISYYEDEHQNLKDQISLLADYGYIFDVTESNTPKYQLDEGFLEFLKSNKAT